MSGVDLTKNKKALLDAHSEVSDPNSETDWALFGYEGQTNVLKVVEKGDGGIEELIDEFNSGRIQYSYLRVKDPNSGLPKYVLINWQGEGVPEIKKGSCASHFKDISFFLKGAHVTINARSEDDIDEDTITQKVAKASGANYGFHKEKATVIPEAGPVNSVYKKTVPVIKSDVRDEFWRKQLDSEKQRKEEDQLQRQRSQSLLEEERKQREAAETAQREEREAERLKKIRDIKAAERKADQHDSSAETARWENTQKEALKDDEERRKRSDLARKQRAAEAQSLVSRRASNPKSIFEQKPASMFDDEVTSPTGPPPKIALPRSPQSDQTEISYNSSRSPEPVTPQEQAPAAPLPRLPAAAPVPRLPAAAPAPAASAPRLPAAAPAHAAPVPPRQPAEPEPVQPEPVRSPQDINPPVSEVSQAEPVLPKTRNLLADGLPKRQDSSDEQEDQDWEEESETQQPAPQTPTAAYIETPPAETETSPTPAYQDEGTIFLDKGQCARALYDYQAEDETEITFDPEDIITNIEQIDEGWWTGLAPNGHQGMFPANYVELI